MDRLSFLDKMSENFCCGPVNLNTFSAPTKHFHPLSKNKILTESGSEDKATTSISTSKESISTSSTTPSMMLQLSRGGDTHTNPFSYAVVGNIKSAVSCTHKQKLGIFYITQRAICFRRVGFFGIEVERMVIPFDIVKGITIGSHHTKEKQEEGWSECDHQQQCIILTTTRNEEYHFSNMKDEDQVLSQLQQAHKEAKESPFVLQKGAVNRLFRSITTLSSATPDTDTPSMSSDNSMEKSVGENNDELDETKKGGVVLDLSGMKKDGIEQQMDVELVWKEFVDAIDEKKYKQKVVMVRKNLK